MSLTTGRGPLSPNPAGRFSTPLPDDVVYVEPFPRRIRAVLGGTTVLDTEGALLVHRPGRPPSYAFPASDLTGIASAPEPAADGFVAIAWDLPDTWFEEEEEVRGHPRNPYHRIDSLPSTRRLHVEVHGLVIVETTDTVALFDDAGTLDEGQMVERLLAAVDERTRVVALTWVHSDTGVKLPVRVLAEALAERSRQSGREIILGVDGVHGFGVEDVTLGDLGCHFFAAGCHKWLYGPRGTGVLYAAQASHWDLLTATIPPFGIRSTPGLEVTPGGFHAFEHRWALADAFRFHKAVGQARITARVRSLCAQLKEGLSALPGVRLLTPLSPERSAGIVSFEVEGQASRKVVSQLRAQGYVVTQSPYGEEAVRATPGYVNTPEEMDRFLEATRVLVRRPGR